MKKAIALFSFILTAFFAPALAQDQNMDPKVMLQRMTDRVKPDLMSTLKLDEKQAEKTIEAQFQWQRSKRELRMANDMNEEDRKNQNAEVDARRVKELKAIPLNDEQVKAVVAYFEEMRKQQAERRKQNGN